ncbi:hypothetical protein [Carnobacterium maltaromaticum]|uniref:hypothetical protein n=1 Tax=Carnobacterium maltaromaticum TaxID=2751 RepID=UPI0039B04FC8
MTLFPDLDKELTKENVDELLSSCRSLIRYVHEDYIPKVTQTYSFEIKERRMIGQRYRVYKLVE